MNRISSYYRHIQTLSNRELTHRLSEARDSMRKGLRVNADYTDALRKEAFDRVLKSL